jgi:hypothetical protein
MLPTEMSKTFPGTIIPLYYLQHFFGARAAATEPHPFFYLEKQMERYVCVCVMLPLFGHGDQKAYNRSTLRPRGFLQGSGP